MILQALNEYYQRKTRLRDGDLAPPGFEYQPISFLVVLTASGEFAGLDDTREGEGKKKVGKTFLVPQTIKRTSNIAANLLWGRLGYVFGKAAPKKLEEKLAKAQTDKEREAVSQRFRDRLEKQQQAFVKIIEERFAQSDDAGIQAIREFLKRGDFSKVFEHPRWNEILESDAYLTFRLKGDDSPVCEREAVVIALSESVDDTDADAPDDGIEQITAQANAESVDDTDADAPDGFCLVSGKPDAIKRTHPPIKGVLGTNTAGGKLVSFQKDSGYDSYGKEQGFNAPVGKCAAFAYTTALNHLLAKGSRQRMQVGDASTVFWAAQPEHPMETLFGAVLKDNPDAKTQAVAALFAAPQTGVSPQTDGHSFDDDDTRFYVLGLAPNVARIAVRFWHCKTVKELVGNIRRHFKDIAIVHAPHEPDTLSLFCLLVSTATLGKAENIPPNLGGEVMRALIDGLPYPQTLLAGAVRRIRAERGVTYPRAAIIKACINRQLGKEELKVSLDENKLDPAYRSGRLFAALERAQERASPNINATIRDRYYGAASSTPMMVFPTLLKLKNHHIAKLDNKGEATNLEKLFGQIIDGITDFPAQLGLKDQCQFAIGYYHQRQAFFTKPNESTQGNKHGTE